jgi:hypothetical protein
MAGGRALRIRETLPTASGKKNRPIISCRRPTARKTDPLFLANGRRQEKQTHDNPPTADG